MTENRIKHRALVTGATRGIGFAIAKRLINDGLEVIATGTGDVPRCPDGAIYHTVDFLSEESTMAFVDLLKQQEIDVLVNNAGINKIGEFVSIPIDDFDRVLRVNLRTPFLLCQAVIPYMKEKGWGRIVNLTSIFGNVSKEYRAPYSASKFGLDGMSVALSAELSAFGVLANSVGPGVIDTELTQNVLGSEGIRDLKSKIPIQRLGRVDEVASLVSWLVSEENTYLTGQNIMVDGGYSLV